MDEDYEDFTEEMETELMDSVAPIEDGKCRGFLFLLFIIN